MIIMQKLHFQTNSTNIPEHKLKNILNNKITLNIKIKHHYFLGYSLNCTMNALHCYRYAIKP